MILKTRTNSEKIILVLIIFLTYTVFAQTDQLIPVLTEVSVTYPGIWSPNSESFVYKDLREDIWHQLDIDTLVVNASADFPFAIELSAEEEAFFEPRGLVIGLPDHELIFFTRFISEPERFGDDNTPSYELVIGNRNTREIFTAMRFDPFTTDHLHSGDIYWSDDGYKLTIEGIRGAIPKPYVTYIHILDPNNLSTTQVFGYPEIVNDQLLLLENFDSDGIQDMNADGDRVLLIASSQENYVSYIVEWYPIQETSRIVSPAFGVGIEGGIISPFYSPLNDNHIIYWRIPPNSGLLGGALYLYNIDTQQETLLWMPDSPTVTRIPSPDGRWMIIVNNLQDSFLLDVISLLEELPITD